MATEAQFEAGFNRVGTATTNIAAVLRDLRDKLASGGLTPAQEEAQLARLGQVADSLEAMAVTPTDPVPVEPPIL